MCIPGYWLGGFHRTPAPRKLSYPLGWGTLGCAFPQGLGAALAGAGPAVSISGDGGFLYACGELAAAKQENIPLTAVIVDDGGYGMIRYDQDLHGDPREGVDLMNPDFVALAASFGVRADSVDGLGEHFGGGAEGPRGAEGAHDARGARGAGAAAERVAALVPAVTEGPRDAEPRGSPRGRASPRRLARRAGERIPPRAELMEQAAEASRAGLRSRRERIITLARPILQTSVAASAAWLIATELVGHDQPFFAPISAVVTLGLTVGERRRRAVELAIGVAVGIAIADLLVAAIGTGTWQIGVVCGLAMLAATLVGGGPLLASQAGASAVLVATLQPPEGFDFERALDALVGSGHGARGGIPPAAGRPAAAGAGGRWARCWTGSPRCWTRSPTRSSTATPARPSGRSPPSGRVDALYDHLTDTLVRGRRRRAHLARPPRQRSAGSTATRPPWSRSGVAIENVRALARGAVRAIALDDSTPPEVIAAIRELATAVRELGCPARGGRRLGARPARRRCARCGWRTPCWRRLEPLRPPHRRPGPPRGGGPAASERNDARRGAGGRARRGRRRALS